MKFLIGLIISCLVASTAAAATSSYSKFNIDKDCNFEKAADEEIASIGASGICKIDGKPDVYFYEGDLRQTLGFGAGKSFETFGAWNNINNVIEWRGDNSGNIYAAIVRFFIDSPNPDTGMVDKASRGQILVVHKVAQTKNDETCVVGLIDAWRNKEANLLAREIADTVTASFNCTTQEPKYHGNHKQYPTSFHKTLPDPKPTTVN
uniref:DUF3558 domain-containing protein n=1 Tax=OCS116 cluster bacterium TaxID=2030921 RepID=A0A2A4YPB2_9PROT